MCALPMEAAYHGIRRTRYAGDRYAVPIQTHFFNSPGTPAPQYAVSGQGCGETTLRNILKKQQRAKHFEDKMLRPYGSEYEVH